MPHSRVYAAGIILAGLAFALPIPILKRAPKPEFFVYIGSGADPERKGIFSYKFDPSGVTFAPVETEVQAGAVVSLARHPGNKFLYAVGEGDSVTAFALRKDTGGLRVLNRIATKAKEASSVAVERKGWMLAISGRGGILESFRVAGDGGVGDSTGTQQTWVASQGGAATVTISPDNLFLFAPGPGKIFQYHLDPARAIVWPNETATAKSGAATRALVFRADGKMAYGIDEAGSAALTFEYDRINGRLGEMERTPLGTAHPVAMEMDGAGRFVYVASVGDDGVTVLAVDGKRGGLRPAQHLEAGCKAPRHLAIDPTGRFLFVASEEENRVALFPIDRKTGRLEASSTRLDVPKPTCFQFVPVAGPDIH